MHRLFFCMLLLLPIASVVVGQGKKQDPDKKDDPAEELLPAELGGSTEKATLVLNPKGHVGAIQGTWFTRDGAHLITVGVDKTVQFWDAVNGERVRMLRLPFQPTAVALAPDRKTLAIARTAGQKGKEARPRHICLVNLDDSRVCQLTVGRQHPGKFDALAFSHDGDQLAGAIQGGGSPVNLIWKGLKGVWQRKPEQVTDIIPRPFTPTNREMFSVQALAFAPDGKRIAMGRDSAFLEGFKSAHLATIPEDNAKPQRPTPLNSKPGANVLAVTWTPDGKQIVTTDRNSNPVSAVKFFSPDGTLDREYKLGKRDGAGLHFLNDKTLLLTWFNDGSAKKIGKRGHGQSILTLDDPITERKGPYVVGGELAHSARGAISPDGKLAAMVGAGAFQNEIVLWESATGKVLHHLGKELTTARIVGWSKDNKSIGLDPLKDGLVFRHALDYKELQLKHMVPRSDYLFKYRTNGDWSTRHQSGVVKLFQKDTMITQPGHSIASTIAPGKEPHWWAHTLSYHGGTLHLKPLPPSKGTTALAPSPQRVLDLAPSPDARFLLSVNDSQVAFIHHIPDDLTKLDRQPLAYLYQSQVDWILWTKEGYYAASPNGERLMGWAVDNGPHKLPTFYPAERFRKQLLRPDVIKLLFVKGNVRDALKAADLARKVETRDVNIDEMFPPRAVLTVVDKSKLPLVKVKVNAEATSKDQPITALRLMIDGRVAPGEATLIEFKDGKAKAEIEWTFELPEGDHQLGVLARSPDSAGKSPSVPIKNVKKAKQPVLHLLAIGINNYNNKALNLRFAEPDADALTEAFPKYCTGQPFRKVVTHKLVNKQATRQQIIDKLAEIRSKTEQQDLVVVFFACHGVKENKEYYLLTHEANLQTLATTSLSGADLRKHLGQFKCQVLLMLDACHSAGIGGGKLAQRGLKPATDDIVRDLTDDEYGIAIMCAAMGHEKAEAIRGHGLFTQAVLDTLEKKPGVPIPYNRHNDRVYVHHLHSFVFDEVSTRSENRQHPFLSLPWIVESFVVR
ncbi:MAG TPA: caspase family protein [Gemmataceae bacterium]|nr:caspase family protein [Gemmataceae bacterium]